MLLCQRKKGYDVSSSIRTSLNKLYNAVEKLEHAVEAKKSSLSSKKSAPPQNDLFGAMTQAQQAPSNFNAVNVRMLASRLDTAINQVEEILKEGRG